MHAQEINSGNKTIPKAQQHRIKNSSNLAADSLSRDSLTRLNLESYESLEDTVNAASLLSQKDSIRTKPIKERKNWLPNSSRATWMATIIPGGGQIYNRKYWKLPIIYGGFAACVYALNWNNQMYGDYSQAYLDIIDNNPNTNSFKDIFQNRGFSEEQMKNTLKTRKDFYRRNRDLSIFAIIGVYIISIIDAYVDAELSSFDISKDLSFKIEPTIVSDSRGLKGNSLGLQCSIKF